MPLEIEEKATFLPNPDVYREQCVEACNGCNKIFSDENIGDVCIAYVYPKKMHKLGHCALASNKATKKSEKKKVNPLKASRRKNRR